MSFWRSPAWLAASIRHKLLAMALLPLAVVFPLLVLALTLWSNVAYDRLMITKVRADLAVAQGYFEQVLGEVGSGTLGVAASHALVRVLQQNESTEALLMQERGRLRLDFLNFYAADAPSLPPALAATLPSGPLHQEQARLHRRCIGHVGRALVGLGHAVLAQALWQVLHHVQRVRERGDALRIHRLQGVDQAKNAVQLALQRCHLRLGDSNSRQTRDALEIVGMEFHGEPCLIGGARTGGPAGESRNCAASEPQKTAK